MCSIFLKFKFIDRFSPLLNYICTSVNYVYFICISSFQITSKFSTFVSSDVKTVTFIPHINDWEQISVLCDTNQQRIPIFPVRNLRPKQFGESIQRVSKLISIIIAESHYTNANLPTAVRSFLLETPGLI